MKWIIRCQLAMNERISALQQQRDRGASEVLGWVMLGAITVTVVALVYVAVEAKVLEKIGIIESTG
ncbi:hypothetical protein [Streptomyces xiamenensis]|uniref:hypothetical protein n=1 Tax=Streptomyces xiamenensis TaxID=408015 RepID=UPI0035DD54E0